MKTEIIIAVIGGIFTIIAALIGSPESLPGIPKIPDLSKKTLKIIIRLIGGLLFLAYIFYVNDAKYILFLQCFLGGGILAVFLTSYGLQKSYKKLAVTSTVTALSIVVTILNLHALDLLYTVKNAQYFFVESPFFSISLFIFPFAVVLFLQKSLNLDVPKTIFFPLEFREIMKKDSNVDKFEDS